MLYVNAFGLGAVVSYYFPRVAAHVAFFAALIVLMVVGGLLFLPNLLVLLLLLPASFFVPRLEEVVDPVLDYSSMAVCVNILEWLEDFLGVL